MMSHTCDRRSAEGAARVARAAVCHKARALKLRPRTLNLRCLPNRILTTSRKTTRSQGLSPRDPPPLPQQTRPIYYGGGRCGTTPRTHWPSQRDLCDIALPCNSLHVSRAMLCMRHSVATLLQHTLRNKATTTPQRIVGAVSLLLASIPFLRKPPRRDLQNMQCVLPPSL
jgi:hypothetical protein